MRRLILLISLSLLIFLKAFTQKNGKATLDRKENFYVYWGWNHAWYSTSNIHFKGLEYDFTLDHVVAKDRETAWDPNIYLNPKYATIPQYNFRMGYYLNANYSISLGIDHMKYVVMQGQFVPISGDIQGTFTAYDKHYENESILIEEDFLLFEHTDGLNYINMDARKIDETFIAKHIYLEYFVGVGAGALYPKTNVTLFNNTTNDAFYWSGYGLNLLAGINVTFYKYFFIQTEGKLGWIHMPSIHTTNSAHDKARQSFFFTQFNYVFGARFHL